MSQQVYDSTMRGIFQMDLSDWLERFGVPRNTRLEVIDSDLSATTARSDKAFVVLTAKPLCFTLSINPASIRT